MPSTTPLHLLIIDQSLKGFEGHHYEYDLAVLEAAVACAGIKPMMAVHREFPSDRLGPAPVIGRFAGDWREAARSPARAALHRGLTLLPEYIRRPLLKIAATQQHAADNAYVVADTRFAQELFGIITKARLEERDHVLIHTLAESELMAVGAHLASDDVSRPHIHIVLRHDGTEAATRAFALFDATPAAVHFWTDTEQLAEHYRQLGCRNIGVLPIPHAMHDPAIRPRSEGHKLTLAYLGGARGDKGFHLLPDLVEALADEYLATGRARFRIQTNYALSREEPLMAAAKRRLKRFPRAWVELIEQPLNAQAFNAAFCGSDLLLLPYDREIYRRRSSGLLVKAMVAGVPAIVPEGTWLAYEAPVDGHVVFGERLTLHKAVKNAIEDYERLAASACAFAPQAQAKHSVELLVRTILRGFYDQ